MTAPTDALRDVIAFLLGEAPLDGRWFGDEDVPLVAGKYKAHYWWRTPLRKASEALATPAGSASGEDKTIANVRALGDGRWLWSPRIGKPLKDLPEGDHELVLASDYAALQAEVARLREDAARYQWLRMQDWFSGSLCVLRDPKKVLTSSAALGADCPSRERLDAAIDAAMGSANGQG